MTLEFAQPITFNVVSLRESLPLGQRVDRFAIGARRLLRGPDATTSRMRLRIVDSPVCPAISEWGLFHALA